MSKFKSKFLYLLLWVFSELIIGTLGKYKPTWKSLDSRPLPEWYDKAKVGIFLHWGVYSVPSFSHHASEWFWPSWKNKEVTKFREKNYPSNFMYQDFAKDFTAEFFNPTEWANLFEKTGAKYVVITSKHHDGFTLWPSTYTFGWNAYDMGPHRDLLGDLAQAIRKKQGLKFGVYYSLYEWYNRMFLFDKKNKFKNNTYVTNKMYPEMQELVTKYKPAVLWADGSLPAKDTYWKSTKFLAWLYNKSPVRDTVVVNDRWGKHISCHHGGFFTCKDRYNPGKLVHHKWENAMTIDEKSWGYRRNANINDYMTTQKLIDTLVETVSCGGNININVGPTHDGRIAPIFQERLLDLGEWLKVNGEAIYDSKPWLYQKETLSKTWYTSHDSNVYAITLLWPEDELLRIGCFNETFADKTSSVTLLGYSNKLDWNATNNSLEIKFPSKSKIYSNWAWVVKFETTLNMLNNEF